MNHTLPPGTWAPVHGHAPLFRCPNGHELQLFNYTIILNMENRRDGETDRRVNCPYVGCGFNEKVVLVDWELRDCVHREVG